MSEDKPNNVNQKAVALTYDGGLSTPRVVATGEGHIADKIIALAEEHNVPLYKDEDLVGLLARLDLEDDIPVHLYQAVAEVLAFVFSLNDKAKEKTQL